MGKKEEGPDKDKTDKKIEFINFKLNDYTIDTRQFEIFYQNDFYYVKCYGRNSETMFEIIDQSITIKDEMVIGIGHGVRTYGLIR